MSVLPTEVLKYIMRFVASSSCDMRAIEQISRVRGRGADIQGEGEGGRYPG